MGDGVLSAVPQLTQRPSGDQVLGRTEVREGLDGRGLRLKRQIVEAVTPALPSGDQTLMRSCNGVMAILKEEFIFILLRTTLDHLPPHPRPLARPSS